MEIGEGIVIENSPISDASYTNISRQIVSTLNGIKKAQEMGALYVLKTRTDQRFYDLDMNYLLNLLLQFPVNNEFLHKRIICLRGRTFVPYHISDFFYFGNISDVFQLFNFTSLDIRMANCNKEDIDENNRMLRSLDEKTKNYTYQDAAIFEKEAFYKLRFSPESIIMKNLAKRTQKLFCEYSLDSYYRFIKEAIIFINMSTLGFYWKKYNWETNEHLDCHSANPGKGVFLNLEEWLDIYLNY